MALTGFFVTYIVRPLGLTLPPRGRLVRVILQDAIGGSVKILELTGLQRPQERRKPQQAEEQRDRDEPGEGGHGFSLASLLRSLSAFAVTKIDEVDIAIAATSGVTNPAIAIGTNSTL